ncbi:hypothetical protein CLV74_11761 [Donghicola tyrosinivorans]|jgi:hypothetical protein|uniref:Uncharacterized protein n=1 Tax=Donghicola tyrosinivorans TaxID=1652492 RepID=A0A2T0WEZ6_9RHOB|nr:hypothetical protein [Pseudomonadota bacterium]PRY85236.1 hypothetical protein CLV74_11761 [Donghicola tyrosinivorans]
MYAVLHSHVPGPKGRLLTASLYAVMLGVVFLCLDCPGAPFSYGAL